MRTAYFFSCSCLSAAVFIPINKYLLPFYTKHEIQPIKFEKMRNKMDFKTDLNNLIKLINDGSSQDEIKKAYLIMVKKYHPDGVAENLKSTYNEYMVVLNSVYARGKTKVREVKFKNPESDEVKKKQNEYCKKVFELGKAEFGKGFRSIHENLINKLDRKAMDQNTLEIMGHYLNAIKCYGFILKNCTDRVLVDSAAFEYNMLQDYNAKLAKTLLNNNENMLVVK